MGAGCDKMSDDSKKSADIDAYLNTDKRRIKEEIKLLLLGNELTIFFKLVDAIEIIIEVVRWKWKMYNWLLKVLVKVESQLYSNR